MPNASNAALYVEQGQTLVDYVAMTDSGDAKVFTAADDIFSGRSGKEPVVRPNGVATGRNLVTVNDADDTVTIAAFTAYSKGSLKSVAATTAVIDRPETKNFQVYSITMTDSGAIAVVDGTEGDSIVETRAAAGGPPLIPADSVEIAQVRVTSQTAAAITDGEIYQVIGQHCERYDYPVWTTNNVGQGGAAEVASKTNAFVEFNAALQKSHDDGAGDAVAKNVYIRYYEPTMSEVTRCMDFVPPETSYSVSSTQLYQGSIATKSETLGQGSFSAMLADGVGDGLIADKGQVLTFKFFPDKNKGAYILCQGTLGVTRTFPVANQISAACTISAEVGAAEFSA